MGQTVKTTSVKDDKSIKIGKKSISKVKLNKRIWGIFRALLLIGLGFIVLYPILMMASMSFRTLADYKDRTVIWIPKNFTFDNIRYAVKHLNYFNGIKQTLLIAIPSIIFQLVSCSMAGYGFARYKFRGKGLLFSLMILTIIVPTQTIIVPFYLKFRYFDFFGIGSLIGLVTGNKVTVNLLNSPVPFYLTSILGMGIKSGLYIYIFRQFFIGMPKELEDAARIDGCSEFTIFSRVMIPNAGSALLTVFLFSLVWHWNEFYLTNLFYNKNYPITVALTNMISKLNTTEYAYTGGGENLLVEAGGLLVVLPIIILYIFAQKYFTESIERTGITGC